MSEFSTPQPRQNNHNHGPKLVGILVVGVSILALVIALYSALTSLEQRGSSFEEEARNLIFSQQVKIESVLQQIEHLRTENADVRSIIDSRFFALEDEIMKDREKQALLNSSGMSIDYENIPISSVVRLNCFDPTTDQIVGFRTGSGVMAKNNFVITNAHVVNNNENMACIFFLQENPLDIRTQKVFYAEVLAISSVSPKDIAFLEVKNQFNGGVYTDIPKDYIFPAKSDSCKDDDVKLGDALVVVGYPTIGGPTVTLTEGIVSGFEDDFIKTSAKIELGNSGGAAFHYSGCWLGIPTQAIKGQIESLGLILRFEYDQ